jgi:hypothetical protein
MTYGPITEVRILRFPLKVWAEASERFQGLLREFALMTLRPDMAEDVPVRLRALISSMQERYSGFLQMTNREREEALAAGLEYVDLTYRLPSSAKHPIRELLELLDEADEFCRQGDLLTLAAPPEDVEYRRWLLGEFLRQLDGEPPTPWPG